LSENLKSSVSCDSWC